MEHGTNYIPLLTISVLAFVVPLLTGRLARIKNIRIPTMIGEIAAGIVIGKSGLDLITPDSWVNFLSTFGFGYLMFLSGLELNFDVVLGRKKPEKGENTSPWASRPLLLGALFFLTSLALGYLISSLLVRWGYLDEPFLITLIMATISLGIVVPALKEQNYAKTAFGQNMIVVSSLADFGSIILVTILAALYTGGSIYQLLLGLLLVAAVIVMYTIGQKLREHEVHKDLPEATSQMGVRFSLASILIFMAIAESMGIEAILGSFLAGALISILIRDERKELQHKLEAIGYGFFIPAFFIMVGVDFDLFALLGSWQALKLVPILLLIAFLVKLVPALWYRMAFSWRETLATGALLSAQLSFTIAAAAIGLQIGIINEALHAALILVALFTSFLSPLLFNSILPAKKEGSEPKIVIIGTQRRINAISQSLETGEMEVVTYEVPEDHKPTPEELAELKLDEVAKVIITTDSEEENYHLAKIVSQHYSPAEILVIGRDSANTRNLEKLGVRSVTPTSALIMLVNHLINHPGAFNLLYDETHSSVTEVHLPPDSPAVGKAVKELDMPEECLILTIVRDGHQHIVPAGDTVLQAYDTLYIIGKNREAVTEAGHCLLGGLPL